MMFGLTTVRKAHHTAFRVAEASAKLASQIRAYEEKVKLGLRAGDIPRENYQAIVFSADQRFRDQLILGDQLSDYELRVLSSRLTATFSGWIFRWNRAILVTNQPENRFEFVAQFVEVRNLPEYE